jgi:hypothetical protein
MISRKITAAIAGVAVVGALGGGTLALASDDGPASSPSVTTQTGSDDGTADQGHGDAVGTQAASDDGTADQGHGDAVGTQTGSDDGTADQGQGDRSGHGGPGRG